MNTELVLLSSALLLSPIFLTLQAIMLLLYLIPKIRHSTSRVLHVILDIITLVLILINLTLNYTIMYSPIIEVDYAPITAATILVLGSMIAMALLISGIRKMQIAGFYLFVITFSSSAATITLLYS